MKVNLVDQFKILKKQKEKPKEQKARGPVDVPKLRAFIKEKNAKNRLP